MSPRNRRVPPRGNPDPTESHTTGPPPAQSGTLPWRTLIITTAATTMVGYVTLEGIRALHGYFKARREEKHAAQLNPEPKAAPPGRLDNGNFQLPLPDGSAALPMSGPPHQGFAAPRLVDVNNPMGAIQHEIRQHQAATNARFQRLEQMLHNAYTQQPPGGFGHTG